MGGETRWKPDDALALWLGTLDLTCLLVRPGPLRRRRVGRTKAAVLPDPVGAEASTSCGVWAGPELGLGMGLRRRERDRSGSSLRCDALRIKEYHDLSTRPSCDRRCSLRLD